MPELPPSACSETFPVGSEVTVTVTGRVVASDDRSVVVEYLGSVGMPTRDAFQRGSEAVTVAAADPPPELELVRRLRAAWLTARGCHDPEGAPAVQRDLMDRWNDAFPYDVGVRYWPGVRYGAGVESGTRSGAEMLGDRAVVWVDGRSGAIALTHVEPVGPVWDQANATK